MISTLVMVYLGAWVLTAAGTYLAGRILSDPDRPADNPLVVSLAAGAVWPLVLLGAIELSSLAVYSTAMSSRTPHTIPESWLRDEALRTAGPLS